LLGLPKGNCAGQNYSSAGCIYKIQRLHSFHC